MSFTCIIIEDQLQAQKVLERHISNVSHLSLLGVFNNALDVVHFLKSNAQVDIVFLDINLPKLNGIDFLRTFRPKTSVIITSAYSEYAIEGFDLDVIDYLIKPISFDRFFKAISKVIYKESVITDNLESKQFLFVKDGHNIMKVVLRNIVLIKSDSDFTTLILQEKKLLLSYSLKFWQQVLPKDDFFRCHKSYIINLRMIDKIVGNTIYINEKRIPIGRTSKEALIKKINLI